MKTAVKCKRNGKEQKKKSNDGGKGERYCEQNLITQLNTTNNHSSGSWVFKRGFL